MKKCLFFAGKTANHMGRSDSVCLRSVTCLSLRMPVGIRFFLVIEMFFANLNPEAVGETAVVGFF